MQAVMQDIRKNFESALEADPHSVESLSQFGHFKLFMSDFTGKIFQQAVDCSKQIQTMLCKINLSTKEIILL